MKKTALRVISLVLALLIVAPWAALPPAQAAPPATLSVANGNIEAIVSTANGGFLIRTLAGDVIAKDDDNKDLLYRNDGFDTSFTSFRVTEAGGGTKEYIFGNDYSYLGLDSSDVAVTKTDTGIKAVWTVDGLTFTQLLEPVTSEQANEHGTVKISYSVVNGKGNPVQVEARLLLDTALGGQDYASYELAKSGLAGDGYRVIENEQVLDTNAGDYLPPSFFAYDDYDNPTMAAYTISDPAQDAVRPYRIAFGHWNNLAATRFEFAPDGDLTFTNPYNRSYLTADSALAFYFAAGTVAPGATGSVLSTYYGVDSKVRVKDSDRVGITVTSPFSLALNEAADGYLNPDPKWSQPGEGYFEITTNITNLIKNGAQKYSKIAVAVLVDDGLTPLNDGGGVPDPLPSNKAPYAVDIGDFGAGEMRTLTWRFQPQVLSDTTYRKIVFRAYDMSDPDDQLLVLDNLIGSSTTYILCPGGNGALPSIAFTGAGPRAIYNEGTRHIYLTGSGFSLLKATGSYTLRAYLKSDRSTYFDIKPENIVFPDEPGVIDVTLREAMPVGEYELVFEWDTPLPGIPKSLTAPVLSFTVTADEAFKNDTYGIAAVVKTGSLPDTKYVIKLFSSEAAYKAFTGDVLLVFRGEFSITGGDEADITSLTGIVSGDEIININGALDFEDGNVRIYRDSSGSQNYLMVEFNGDLYTTNSHTAVWSGEASLTPLNDGADYSLIKYDDRGNRTTVPANPISLVWPSGFNMLQTIAGLAVDFRYGQFGAMYDADSKLTGYVVSFGGKLDLSFLMPGGTDQAQDLDRKADDKRRAALTSRQQGEMLYDDIDGYSPSEEAQKENEENKVEPVGKVNIEDILYGGGEGFLGFNSSVEVMLPKYFQPLPPLGGKLSINTIGGYAVGVAGTAKTKKFDIEFELTVKNAPDSGTPVPDKIYFFMAGFEPGVNVDGAGAVWITGLGGGVDKLYDTIFSNGGLPPLTLLLSAQFDIMKVMSGRSDLELSLTGFTLKCSDVKLKNTSVVVIDSGQLGVQWDPKFILQLATQITLYDTINGNAYFVVDGDFFEMFLRATVNVPKDVDIVGGMAIANVDLGGNNDKIWGVLKALGIQLGVTYYWGGDVHFGTGANTSSPTYPDLLGFQDAPVGVNGETGETLYVKVGTNLSVAAQAEPVADLDAPGLVLMADGPVLRSEGMEKMNHELDLGADTGNDAALTITFKGDDRPKTVAEAKAAIAITEPDGATPYVLNFYDGTNPDEANANLIVDDTAKTTTVALTITEYIAGTWRIVTSQAANLVLYSVTPMPEVAGLTANYTSGTVNLTWTGSQLDETKLSFYVTPDLGDGAGDAGELGTLIGRVGGTAADGSPMPVPKEGGDSATFTLPADLQSGRYYIRMITSKEGEVNQTVIAKDGLGTTFAFDYVNPGQPGEPSGVTLRNCGNNMFAVTVANAPSGSFDGYSISICESTADGLVPTAFTGLRFAKDETGAVPEMRLGGTYTATDGKNYGLAAGRAYVASVAAYRINDGGTPADASDDVAVLSGAVKTSPVTLAPATTPTITLVPEAGVAESLPKTITLADGTTATTSVATYTTNEVRFTLRSDVPVTGFWSIDGTLAQNLLDPTSTGIDQVTDVTTIDISRTLCDGEHTVTFSGADGHGDRVNFTQLIAVDTRPPRLMLSSPVNGSFFGADGRLTIEGISDNDALLTIAIDDQIAYQDRTLASLGAAPDEFGRFSFVVPVAPGVSSHSVRITATDPAGNSTSAAATVTNIGMARVRSVAVLCDGLSTENIPASGSGDTTVRLQLLARTDSSAFVINGDNLVQWTTVAATGSAAVEPDGTLMIGSGSVGYAAGNLRTGESAGLSAGVAFGAEIFGGGQCQLMLSSTSGGSVIGGGAYLPGTAVTITATPNAGYRFTGWSHTGSGTLGDPFAAATIFTMPNENASVTANFSLIDLPQPPRHDEEGEAYAAQGSRVAIPLTASAAANPNSVVAYYVADGKDIIVPLSDVVDGQLVFVAPVSATFRVATIQSSFRDTVNHWAKNAIDFTVARGLFSGIGDRLFDPNGQMTRAMFATVIARLDGADLTQYSGLGFADVPAGSWYSQTVAWATACGVAGGVSANEFAPDAPVTREQMATMISNYLTYKGCRLSDGSGSSAPFSDGDSISSWARAAVEEMRQSGIILGRPGGAADPQGLASRAECSAVFQRLIRAILAR